MSQTRPFPTDTGPVPFRLRWWHGLLFWLVINAYGFFERGGEPFPGYQPSPLQPPAWVFPAVWLSMSLVHLWGGMRLLTTPHPIANRQALMGLQGATWLLYGSFNAAYFTLGSPILAAIWTVAFFILTAFSIALVWRDDRLIALSWVPLLLWTGFASIVGLHGALLNPDPLFGTPAYLR
jgi:tryptophan-rich sensory protein